MRLSRDKSWLGIDFSGDAKNWGPRCSTSNVWVARLVESHAGLELDSVVPVQRLPGSEHPFHRLANLLGGGDFDGAAIDAPFSLPAIVAHGQDHAALLARVNGLPRSGRPFARASDVIEEFLPGHAPNGEKIYRETESRWSTRGVNVRSTMWAGPRGGAAMTVACMTLLHTSRVAVWPWVGLAPSLVAEAFPAAQLRHWGLPHQKYAGADGGSNRQQIVKALEERLAIRAEKRETLLKKADALDAVLCGFAAVALHRHCLESQPSFHAAVEGWIAVHD